MFKNLMLPCAAGDRCLLQPKLADPQDKCPKCRQNIHAICGILDVNAQNTMNSQICYNCFNRNDNSLTESSSPTNCPLTNSLPIQLISLSIQTMAQNYFESAADLDDDPNASMNILFAMSVCLSDVDIKKEKLDKLIKKKRITKSSITPGKGYLQKEILRRIFIINKREERDKILYSNRTKYPRLKNWGKPKMQEWLKAHPLTGTKKAWVASRVNKFVSDVDEKANNKKF